MTGESELTFSDLDEADQDLCRLAREAAAGAYAPYSRFAVGAAILTATSATYAGANLENASYGLTICAEAAALAAANTAGDREIRTVAVVGFPIAGVPGRAPVITPCGRCRQMIAEFAGPAQDVRILCCAADYGRVLATTIGELLPHAFEPQSLPRF
ncbi:cytidine deaminase [Amorphus orientalis]|uniref:Cytidine deaminase n=1 Tax=Amorphus orientalis TaxID=649198 RepID=A0AAE3VSD9_9HYPH|nr:cytidine deaminase [Amorphus orientalis]MDQ0317330.1 cytidine deaminase [Amorphus orientalis]